MAVPSLKPDNTGLVVVDPQTKLLRVMRRGPLVVDNIIKLLHLADRIELPVTATEQYPRMLGPIAPEISARLPEADLIKKMDFDCCAVDQFNDRLSEARIRNIILTGLETHICILQTALGLKEKGFAVHVPQDAVDSRTEENWGVGIEQMRQTGIVITSTETVIFLLLGKAGTPEFKEMLKIIKQGEAHELRDDQKAKF